MKSKRSRMPSPANTRVPVKKKPPALKKSPSRWLLNSFLYVMIFINGMTVLESFLAIAYMDTSTVGIDRLYSPSVYSLTLFICICNIFFLLQILKKFRWAFWGYCISTLGSGILLLYVDSPKSLLYSLLNILILFGILYMGGKRSAWHEMSNVRSFS